MRIFTESIKKYVKLLSQVFTKGNKFTESVYLDFQEGYLYFSNQNCSGRIKLKIDFENKVENFFVDIPIFLNLVQEYPDLVITEKFEFIHGKEKFKPAVFSKPSSYSILPFNYKEEGWKEYKLDEKIIFNLISSISYMSTKDKPQFNGVLLKDNSISSTDSSIFFRAYLDNSFDEIKLSNEALLFIRDSFKVEKNVSLFYNNDGLICINIGDSAVEIICPKILNLMIPNIDIPEFKSKYDHSTFFIIEKQKLLDVLHFFEPFVKEVRNEKLYFTISDKNLIIEAKDKLIGNRILPLKECSPELNGQTIRVARFLITLSLSHINDDFILIKMDESAPAFCVEGEKNKERNIIIVKIKE